MPKSKPKLAINLDLLKPQSSPEKLLIKLLHWLLSTGRFIFIFVEALVLIAFILRFKLDADLASKKEAIEEQIPYIESLRPYEVLIRQMQLKLATINAFNTSVPNYPQTLTKIADETPVGVKITGLSLEKSLGKVLIQINAQTQSNNDIAQFIANLRNSEYFADVNLSSVGLEQGIIKFTIESKAQTLSSQKNL